MPNLAKFKKQKFFKNPEILNLLYKNKKKSLRSHKE